MTHNLHRLLFIEALLISNQIITRRHLTTTFLIGNATASRDIADYRQLNKENMVFRLSPKKSWGKTLTFTPLFFMDNNCSTIEQQAEAYLNALKLMVVAVATCNKPKERVENGISKNNTVTDSIHTEKNN